MQDTKPPIIALAPNGWNGPWMNRQQLLSRLANRGWPVTYSNGALSLWDRSTTIWKQAGWRGRFEATDSISLNVPGRWPTRWPRFEPWDSFAVHLHCQELVAQAGPAWQKSGVLFLFHPMYLPYVKAMKPRRVAFHVYDAYSQMDKDWGPNQQRLLEDLVERADLLTTSSPAMARTLPGVGPDKARVLKNAADTTVFSEQSNSACPEDLSEIPKPRIGYFGNINRRVDFESVIAVALARPDWHWVFIGHLTESSLMEDDEAREGYLKSLELPNVHYLGSKPRTAVAAYMANVDVNTICYRIRPGEWIEAGYPLKLNEYLAIGRPVVAAPQEIIVADFSSVVGIADTPEKWLNALDHAIKHGGVGSQAQRRALAQKNTWDERVDQLENWLIEMTTD